jgi:2-acylglycerol O-acyltransferase 2
MSRSTGELLQGLAAQHVLLVPTVVLFGVCTFGTYYYPKSIGLCLVVPYYTYILFIGTAAWKTGAPWESFRRDFGLIKVMRRYFRIRLVGNEALQKREAASSPENPQQYILAVFPHALQADFRVLVDGMLDQVLPQTAPRVRTLGATVLFTLPMVREIFLWSGGVDARRSVAERCLKANLSLLVLPGGQQEQLRTQHGHELVYVQRRKGFVKLALRYGTPLVPVYVFGANDYYYTSSWLLPLQLWLMKVTGLSLVVGAGLFGLPTIPRPVDTTMVFGEPLDFGAPIAQPTTEQVEAAHAKFVTALQQLFDQHKEACGYGDRVLEIM